jgi:hypothetical protein
MMRLLDIFYKQVQMDLMTKTLLELFDYYAMNLFDASVQVSLAPGYPTIEFAASGGVLNPKRE